MDLLLRRHGTGENLSKKKQKLQKRKEVRESRNKARGKWWKRSSTSQSRDWVKLSSPN